MSVIDEIMGVAEAYSECKRYKSESAQAFHSAKFGQLRGVITGAIADAKREGAEQMLEACLSECRVIERNKRAAYRKTYSAHAEGASDGATDCAAAIHALPLPTGPRQVVRLTAERIGEISRDPAGCEHVNGLRLMDSPLQFARAIESAVLAANGLETK